MAQVFISYAREDRDAAHALAQALEAAGLPTWWDRALVGGADFAAEIERQLQAVRVVLVLWSEASVASGFVRDESSRARDADKLMPVRIADVRLPLGFGSLHTLDLLDWDGDAGDPACQALVAQVRARVAGEAPAPAPLPPAGGRRLRRALLAGGGVAALGGAGWGLWAFRRAQDEDEAQRLFEAGQAAQFARDPAFAVARDRYREALRLRADQPLVHYHLGTVYLRLYAEGGAKDTLLIDDAGLQFQAALRGEGALDRSQAQDARRQVALLAQRDEAAPAGRVNTEAPPITTAPPSTGSAARPAPAAPPATASPAPAIDFPRPLAATGAIADEARALARRAFEADRAQRSAAASELALRPALASDALAFLLPLAQAAARGEANEAGRDGVLATLTVLQAASPATLREQAEATLPLLTAAPALGSVFAEAATRVRQATAQRVSRRPQVYLQLASDAQRPLAEKIAARMREAGYKVPAFEITGGQRAPERTQLRSQGASSLGLARWCAQATREDTGAPVVLQALRNARPDTDTFELWLARSLAA